jgi:hypothetical protein
MGRSDLQHVSDFQAGFRSLLIAHFKIAKSNRHRPSPEVQFASDSLFRLDLLNDLRDLGRATFAMTSIPVALAEP